jgi:hypothetical protein
LDPRTVALVSVVAFSARAAGEARIAPDDPRGRAEARALLEGPGPNSGVQTSPLRNGDFDRNQLIDGLDLIHEAALLGTTTEDPDYDQTANLVGTTNGIDGADFGALVGKLGGSP